MAQEIEFPHSKLWYASRDLVRNATYVIEDFVRAIPVKISEELTETREHFGNLFNLLIGRVPDERLRTGFGGVFVYDAIYSANRLGLDIGYRHTLKRRTF